MRNKKLSKEAYLERVIRERAILVEHFPSAFANFNLSRLPLKLRIDKDAFERLPKGTLSKHRISKAIGHYVSRPKYLCKVVEGAPRIDLDGVPVDTVTASQAQYAVTKLEEAKARIALRNAQRLIDAQLPQPVPYCGVVL